MTLVLQDAVRAALRRHMLLGESIGVADPADPEGRCVPILAPEEIRQALDAE